jgi:indolepyruvate decarboxylase
MSTTSDAMAGSTVHIPQTSKQASIVAPSIGQYLIRRLQDYGIQHVFGIPGDYVLSFYSMLEHSPLDLIGCCREDNAGFAADAYARVHGMGALCVTYCVGGLSACNSVAGAFAEKSPVVVITGSPGMDERGNDPLLHHRVRDFRTQFEVFEKITVASAELTDPLIAFREIDRVLAACSRYKRPVHIEIPRDMVKVVPQTPYQMKVPLITSQAEALAEVANETAQLINAAKRPVIVAGVEIHRFGLQDQLLHLAEKSGIPITTTLLGKSVIRETHPLFAGLYEGAMGHSEVTEFVESSDCVLLIGTFMTDINLGINTAHLDPSKCIYATSEQMRIRHHHYHGVLLGDFLREVSARNPRAKQRDMPEPRRAEVTWDDTKPEASITISRMIARLNQSLDDKMIVIADVGDSLFAATDLTTRGRTEFLSPAYYTSMGFSVPACLGASFGAPDMRCVVIVGDGAFQMTGMELSSIVRYGMNPIVIVLDNKGYGTERFLHEGDFNNIHPWNYSKLPEVFGGGHGCEVRTEGEFDAALTTALTDTSQMHLIQVHVGIDDVSRCLRRLAEKMSKQV